MIQFYQLTGFALFLTLKLQAMMIFAQICKGLYIEQTYIFQARRQQLQIGGGGGGGGTHILFFKITGHSKAQLWKF